MGSLHHHPRSLTLADYAAGRLDEAMGVVVATHLERCAACRIAVRDFETLGGDCLSREAPALMRESAFDSFWLRAGAQDERRAPYAGAPANDAPPALSPTLSRYLKGPVTGLAWRSISPGISQHVLPASGYRRGALRLLKIAPGTRMPEHSHCDSELTLILSGAYEDSIGRFEEGDVSDVDGEVTHAPVAVGDEACICLIATSAPLRFKTIVGRIVQPFIGL